MKHILRMLVAVLLLSLIGAILALPAAAKCQYNVFADYDQLTFDMAGTTAAPVMDGVVSEGEYGTAMITVRPGDKGTFLSNWSVESNPLSDEAFAALMPEKVTFYLTYDENYLYLAAEVVEDKLYSTCAKPEELWGTENMEFDIGVNPWGNYEEYADEGWTRTQAMERVTVCVGYTDFQNGNGPTPAALIGGTCSYTDYNAWESVEGVGASRNEETKLTTYECMMAWERIYGDTAVPEVISLRYQLYIADGDYLYHVAPGYVNTLGTFRFYGTLTAEEMAATGADGASFPHIATLKDAKAMNDGTFRAEETEPETVPETLPETKPETLPETETMVESETVSESYTETVSETEGNTVADTVPVTQPETEAPADGGCGSVIGFCPAAVLFAVSAAFVLKKRS